MVSKANDMFQVVINIIVDWRRMIGLDIIRGDYPEMILVMC